MTNLIFIEFFYTTWGRILTYILFLIIPFIAGITMDCSTKRRPIGSLLLLSLWFFVVVFETNVFNFDLGWIEWLWMIGSIIAGISSAGIIGPQFDNVKWVDEPICYISASALNSLIIASICILCFNSSWLPLYILAALIFHFFSCENYVMALTPIFSMASIVSMWYTCDFNHWYVVVVFVVVVILHFFLSFFSALTWNLERDDDNGKYTTLLITCVLAIITFCITTYFIFALYSITEFIAYYPYWSLAFIILFLAALVQNVIKFSVVSIISSVAFAICFWSSLYIPGIEFSMPDFSFPSMSFDLSWNWDLFSFTWCSVIMWIGIAFGGFISVALLIGLFVENGWFSFKYIAHTIISGLIVYEFAFANTPEDVRWWYWLIFAIGCFAILIEYVLIYIIGHGNVDNIIIGIHFVISLTLTICICYDLYEYAEPAYLLITSIVSGIICSSIGNVVHRTISHVSSSTRVKPSMQYNGTSMTCPYCRERYKTVWVQGEQEKGFSRDVAKKATNTVLGGVNVAGCTGLGAEIGTAIFPGLGTLVGGGVGLIVGSMGAVVVSKKVNKKVDDVYDYASNEYGDGLDYVFRCGCGQVWHRTVRYGQIEH